MPESEHGDLKRLGDAVRVERVARSWSKEAAARFANISSVTWDRVERGLPAQDTKYAAIATALGWKPDGCQRIMAGLEPELLGKPDTTEPDPTPSDPLAAELLERYEDEGLTELGAEAAAVIIRAFSARRDDSPDQGRRGA